YRDLPLAVADPKNEADIIKLIAFAQEHKTSLIPRTAGTSLAGQCVGKGIVVDVSKHFNQILEVNKEEGWVRVQPGIVRDHLNHYLKDYGLFFGPNTATANRAMIGGMVGNSSCGSYSIVYGTTRDHVIEIKTILSDGSTVTFGPLSKEAFRQKSIGNKLENSIYRQIAFELNHPLVQREIEKEFPKASVKRRNTGYAVDFLVSTNAFKQEGEDFNFCKLLAGSEGTLCFFSEIKLHVDPLPPSKNLLLCVHFSNLEESLKAAVIAMKHHPRQCELMDKIILDCTKENIVQRQNRFFIEGDPGAILMIEFATEDFDETNHKIQSLIEDFKSHQMGYAFPVLKGSEIQRAMSLRAAGLGVLSNVKGSKKPVEFVEDTAVAVEDLPAYIADYEEMLKKYNTESVYYAHAGAGELHLRPILDLKTKEGIVNLRGIATDTALLVKKYNGSMSGEHGDGIVRSEFIPLVLGEKNYQLFKRIKYTWDPNNIFNPGKIVDAPKMDEGLRLQLNETPEDIHTLMDFSKEDGILMAAEKCSGSGDCRKTPITGGTMCPSYMATMDEKDTTRARANILREFLTRSNQKNKFNHKEIAEVMDLCISCKGCKSECPSNVDMAVMKAEFLYQYYKSNPPSFRTKAIANFSKWSELAMTVPFISNLFMGNSALSKIPKALFGVHPNRSLPHYGSSTLKSWWTKNKQSLNQNQVNKNARKVYLFCDEFTNYNDVEIGKKAIQLLTKLGYQVEIPEHVDSGRSFISKGFLKEAKELAEENIQLLRGKINAENPLIGIEPSCILGFRDEIPKMVDASLKSDATNLSQHSYLIDEFIANEIKLGNIQKEQFTQDKKQVVLHGHCHQKAISSTQFTKDMIGIIENYSVTEIPSGCCGMAGSFGYEKEHFEISNQISELVLMPAVRNTPIDSILVAPGTSCRHQILDGSGRKAKHPLELLFEALK
ncbi:MAG: FAD-binding protein, partial [Chitinophagales bacterium]|nr:FAD-binding protein [Chitinophagales bacterium]